MINVTHAIQTGAIRMLPTGSWGRDSVGRRVRLASEALGRRCRAPSADGRCSPKTILSLSSPPVSGNHPAGGRISIHSHTRGGTGFPCPVLVTAHCPALTTGLHNVRVFVSSSLQTCQGLSDLHITCPLTGFQHYPYALQHAFGSLSYLYLIPCIPVCGLGKLTAVQSCLLAQKCSSCLPTCSVPPTG